MWIIAAVLLGAAELAAGGTFVLGMIAIGATAAGISALAGAPLFLQAIIFGGTTIASFAGVRPFLKKALETKDNKQLGTAAFEGTTVIVKDRITADRGTVEMGGDLWTAHPMDNNETYEVGEQVTVVEIKGASVIVWRGL